jgi:hypothetical protein
MANCRTLFDYHVVTQSTLQIMRGAQGCSEAGKSCICATQLQHVLAANRKMVAERETAEQRDQAQKLELLVSSSSRQQALNRVLQLQVESAVLLASARSVHHTESAKAAVQIADRLVKLGAEIGGPPGADGVGGGDDDDDLDRQPQVGLREWANPLLAPSPAYCLRHWPSFLRRRCRSPRALSLPTCARIG